MKFLNSFLTCLACLVVVSSANADIVLFGDSSDFDYKYEMDVDPTTQNLDGAGAHDWFNGTSGGLTSPQTFSGGVAFSDTGAATPEELFRGDFNTGGAGGVWRELVKAGGAADWTLELRVQKVSGTQGSNGWFAFAMANNGESNSSDFLVKDDRLTINDTDYLVGTDFADGNFHTFRVAHDSVDNELYFWANGMLLNADLSTPINGTNGSAFDNSTFIGHYSNSHAGEWGLDYIRLDESAIAVPVPEPTSLALFGFGVLGLTARRRRK